MRSRDWTLAWLLAGIMLWPLEAESQRARKRMRPAPIGSPSDWIEPDDYPPDAVRLEREGRVVVDLGIDSGGKVVSCNVSQSSGTTSLDQKTCELALTRGRFDPATDAKGRPTSSLYKLPVRWVLPGSVTDRAGLHVMDVAKANAAYEIEQVIGTDGKLEGCRMVSRSQDMADLCQQMPMGMQSKIRYTAAGEPVRVVVRMRYSASVEPVKLPQ